MKKQNILLTGCAGFIGFSLANEILKKKTNHVIGFDSVNSYYSKKLKKDRLNILKKFKNFEFYKVDITNNKKIIKILSKKKIDTVVHLAAQAGVRYSLKKPESYIDTNIKGFFNILEYFKNKKINKFIYASSSSVYGEQRKFPIKENFQDNQKNLYALTKKFNENLAEFYANSFKMNLIGLRFFTVYGEWGRPDMLYLKYLDAIKNKKRITLYNFGNHTRDFTYIKDVIEILSKIINLKKIIKGHAVYNICSGYPTNLMYFIKKIEKYYGKKCKIKKIKKQNIEILKTHGSNKKILSLIKKDKFHNLNVGLKNTINWFKNYNS